MRIIILLIFIPILFSCSDNTSQEGENMEREAYGVLVRGYGSKGYILNKNDFTIQIQAVWIFKGESTLFVQYLKPHSKISMEYISHQHGFYVRDSLGYRLLGYIGSYHTKQQTDKKIPPKK